MKRGLSLLVLAVLMVSLASPVLAAQDWPSPFEVKSTGRGIVFGHGRNKVTLEVDMTTRVKKGPKLDVVTAKWNPKQSVLSRGALKRLERWGDAGLCFDLHVERESSELKFDVVSSVEANVTVTLSGAEYGGGWVWSSGRLHISLLDLKMYADAETDGERVWFSVEPGDVIDPLVWYDEALGLYKYDSLADYTPGMWTNCSTYVELGGTSYQNVYDWLIQTKANYATGGSYAQWDFTLVNTREENEPSLIDEQIGTYEFCFYDDDETLWSAPEAQADVAEEATIKVKGSSSLRINATALPTSKFLIRNNTINWDITPYNWIGFWWYGNNTGKTLTLQLSDGANARQWGFTDDYTGWKRLVFPISYPDSDSGLDDTAVTVVGIVNLGGTGITGTWYLDRFVLDTCIPVPLEIGVPDDTTQVKLYGYDGSDYWEYMRWELNGSTYSWINPGALYWNGSNPAAAGRLAKQAAWGNYTWSGPPAGATQAPTQAAQYALNLSYWGLDLTKLMLQANSSVNLYTWNPVYTSPPRGQNVWNDKGWRATGMNDRFTVGEVLRNAGSSVLLHPAENYFQANPQIKSELAKLPSWCNWQIDKAANIYSYEFVVDNDNIVPQNATVEVYMPDNVTTYRVGYWNGTDYVTFIDYGSTLVTQPESINGTTLDAAFYFNGLRGQTKTPINATIGLVDIGPVTYSDNYGVRNRAAFTIALGANDGDPAGPDGADEAKLRVTVVYGDNGEATYEFEDSTNQYYGLQNIAGNMAFLFNPDAAQPSGYLGVLFEEKPTALFVTADENQTITAFEFNVTGDWTVIDSSFDTSATITAVTGETISRLSEYTGFYPDHGYYSRNETGAPGSVEGSTLIPATHVYQKPAGTRYAVAAKVPLPPYGNGTVELSKAPLRVRVTVPAGAHYTARADLASPSSSLWVATLFCDFQPNSYNIRPGLPMKNSTVVLIDPRTGTNWTFTYQAAPLLTPAERMDIRSLTVNGTTIPSKVVPLSYVVSGQNITVEAELGHPATPMVHSVQNGNLTQATWNPAEQILRATMNRTTGQSTLVIDVGNYGYPRRITGAQSTSYNPSTGLLTLTLSHSSPRTASIYWSYTQAGEIIYNVPGYLPLLAVSLIVLAGAFSVLLLRGQTATGVSPGVFVAVAIVLLVSAIVLWSIVSAILNGSVLYLP